MASIPPESQIPVRIGDVVLGKYVVERLIGRGSMGALVAVRHQRLGELFAMKFLLPHLMLSEGGIERFFQEAATAAKLKSEHAVKVHDVGHLPDGAHYMLMEYVGGIDLGSLLSRRGPLPPEEAARHIVQACDAIAEAHSVGIVHRDLKPANLIVTTRPNGSSCVKVLDFGISKNQRPDGYASSMTRTSAVMGSPHYMSPEQIRSAKYVGSSTDIWSLGVVLHELVCGAMPFAGATIGELCSAILTGEPAPLPPHVSPAYRQVVARCLAKRAEQRFASATDLARALGDESQSGIASARLSKTLLDQPSSIPSLVFERDARPPSSAKLAATQTESVSPVAQRPSKKSVFPWLIGGGILCIAGAVALVLSGRLGRTQPARATAPSASSSAAPSLTASQTPTESVAAPPPSDSKGSAITTPRPQSPRPQPPSLPRVPPKPTGHGIE